MYDASCPPLPGSLADARSTRAGAPGRELRYDSVAGGYTPFVRDCLRASLGEIPPPISGAEGLEVLRVIFAAYQAAETGRTVRLT
jgi:predicted dehydrogenase